MERVDDQEIIAFDGLDETAGAAKRFGLHETGLQMTETQPTTCILQADGNQEFYHTPDINQQLILHKSRVLLPINTILEANQ